MGKSTWKTDRRMKLFLLALSLGVLHATYISNDVCKTEYSTVCEDVEKPHIEHKTERKCDTILNQQCRNEQKPVTSTEYKTECRAVQKTVPHTVYDLDIEVVYDNQCHTVYES